MATATVTVLFCDVARSTELAVTLGPDADAVRRSYLALLSESVRRHRGVEVKGLGDGLMAVFRSAPDALGSAVEMQRSISALDRRHANLGLELRVGVATGEATEERGDWFGRPVIEASRLCDVSRPGRILAAALTARLDTAAEVDAAATRSVVLKGLPESVEVVEVPWSPLHAGDAPVPPGLAGDDPTAFVGRAVELDVLLRAWKQAAGGTRQLALVSGDPGIGKTRLTSEVARQAAAEGGLILYGRCDEDLGVPYQPFAEALAGLAGSRGLDALRSAAEHRAADLAPLVPELLDGPGAGREDLEPGEARYRLFTAFAQVMATLSTATPLVLVLDDLHWASPPTLLMLRHLARSPDPTAILLLATYRGTELRRDHPLAAALADLRRDTSVERIVLGGLDADEVGRLVATRADDATLRWGPDLPRTVHRETGGNPFFVGEVLAHLAESKPPDDGAPLSELSAVGLPEGVRDVIGRRLTRLSEETHGLLAVAAVVGQEFDVGLLLSVGDATAGLQALDEAHRAGLLTDRPGGRMGFSHALIRRALIDELSRPRRALLHRQVAEGLAATEQAEIHATALAHHFAEAAFDGRVAPAADWALVAARQAVDGLAPEEAVTTLERALEMLDTASSPDRLRRARVVGALGEAMMMAGRDWDDVRARALEASNDARRAGSAVDLARAAVLYADLVDVGSPDPRARDLGYEALDVLGDDHPELRARLLAGLAYPALLFPDEDDLLETVTEATRLAESSGDVEAMRAALRARSFAMRLTGRAREALEHAEAAMALSERLGHRRLLFDSVQRSLLTSLMLGDRDTAGRRLDRLVALGEEAGGSMASAAAGHVTALALHDGRFDEAEATLGVQLQPWETPNRDTLNIHAGQMVALTRERGSMSSLRDLVADAVASSPGIAAFSAALALACAETGETDQARRVLDDLVADDLEVVPRDVTWTGTLALMAETCAHLGAADRAAAVEHHLVRHSGLLVVVGEMAATLGAVDRYLALLAGVRGRHEEASKRFEAADRLEREARARPALARTGLWWGRHLAEHSRGGDARRVLEEAAAIAAELGMAGVGADIEAVAR